MSERVYCWEQNLTEERLTLTLDGVELGYVEPVGASWQVVNGTQVIAIRPDQETAQRCLIRFQEAGAKGL
jgi:hypothetical protein